MGKGSVFTVSMSLELYPCAQPSATLRPDLKGLTVGFAPVSEDEKDILTELLLRWRCVPLPLSGIGDMMPYLSGASERGPYFFIVDAHPCSRMLLNRLTVPSGGRRHSLLGEAPRDRNLAGRHEEIAF